MVELELPKMPSLVNKIVMDEELINILYEKDSDVFIQVSNELKQNIEDIKPETILGSIYNKMVLAEKFIELVPLYYDEAMNWWMWDRKSLYWKMSDEIDILNIVNKTSEVNVINTKERNEIINALKLVARKNKPKDIDSFLIQFDKEILNLSTGDRFVASPKHFITNPLPFKLGKSSDTSKFDKLFKEWVGNDYEALYEIIAYCLIPEYPIERIFALLGSGANGKSTYLKILYTFLGMKNICTTNLDVLLKSRFETTRLYKKLACIMAETNLSSIENSQLIKRLVSGKDPVPIEFKNKGLIEFINYAKVIIATNNLPPTEDKTDGFYRRWRIISFPHQFEKEVDVLADITQEDYENLGCKCLFILDDILKNRGFKNEGCIAERKAKYEEKSNPFEKFWSLNVDDDNPNTDIPCWEFEKEMNTYMKDNHVRTLSDRTIMKLMKERGINQVRLWKDWYENGEGCKKQMRCWAGISWKK